MTSYRDFCKRFGLDPVLESSKAQYIEAVTALKALYGASATTEVQEAINKVRGR